jgi:hypothetical protein
MKQLLFLFFFFSVSSINVFAQTNSIVRYDGLYQTEIDSSYGARGYLRLYSDSTVLSVTSTGNATQVMVWLKKEDADSSDYSKGKYEIKGKSINFRTTSSSGTVVYEGVIISADKIIVQTKSLINGYEGEEVYWFVEL